MSRIWSWLEKKMIGRVTGIKPFWFWNDTRVFLGSEHHKVSRHIIRRWLFIWWTDQQGHHHIIILLLSAETYWFGEKKVDWKYFDSQFWWVLMTQNMPTLKRKTPSFLQERTGIRHCFLSSLHNDWIIVEKYKRVTQITTPAHFPMIMIIFLKCMSRDVDIRWH